MQFRPVAVRGFTLIELLVVMVIISLVISVAVLSVGDRRGGQEVAAEAQRLAAVIEVARERAEIDALEYGLDVHPDGYRFLQYDEAQGSWQPSQRSALRKREMPAGVRLDVKVDAQALPSLGDNKPDTGQSGDKSAPPGVLLLSSGETSNFRVELTAGAKDGAVWVVIGDGVAAAHASKIAGENR